MIAEPELQKFGILTHYICQKTTGHTQNSAHPKSSPIDCDGVQPILLVVLEKSIPPFVRS